MRPNLISAISRTASFMAVCLIMITNVDFNGLFTDQHITIRIDEWPSSLIKIVFAAFFMYYKVLFDNSIGNNQIIDL